jgi:hypothetical protein
MTRFYKQRRDANHEELSKAFRKLGASVEDMVRTGVEGWPDVCVGFLSVTHLVEYKNPLTSYGRSGLSKNQKSFADGWKGERIWVVDSVEAVVDLITHWRTLAYARDNKIA